EHVLPTRFPETRKNPTSLIRGSASSVGPALKNVVSTPCSSSKKGAVIHVHVDNYHRRQDDPGTGGCDDPRCGQYSGRQYPDPLSPQPRGDEGPQSRGFLPDLRCGGRWPAQPGPFLCDAGAGWNGGQDQHHPSAAGA